MPLGKNMKIGILLYDNCSPWGVTGATEILSVANRIYNWQNKLNKDSQFFEIYRVSAKNKTVKTKYNFDIKCDYTINDEVELDLIIVTGTDEKFDNVLKTHQNMIEWIKKMYEKGTEVVGFCTGSIFLAASGILDNKSASTHWVAENFFRENFPKVKLETHKIIVDESNIYTSGGASSFQNLTIYLIEKFMGRSIAIYTAKTLLIDINKEVQTAYAIFSTQKEHGDNSVRKIQDYIESNYNNKFSIPELAEVSALSERSLMRRFKKATGNTPITYIQRVKVEAAKKILEHRNITFEEIVREIGYEDISNFRKLFKKYTGVSPNVYKEKYAILR